MDSLKRLLLHLSERVEGQLEDRKPTVSRREVLLQLKGLSTADCS